MEMKRILTIGLGFAIGVLALNALVTFWNIRNLIGSGRWVIHTREVLNAMDELLASVRDAESEQRDYLLTADESYLHRAEQSAIEADARLVRVGELTRDNERQQGRLVDLTRRLRHARRVLAPDRGPAAGGRTRCGGEGPLRRARRKG